MNGGEMYLAISSMGRGVIDPPEPLDEEGQRSARYQAEIDAMGPQYRDAVVWNAGFDGFVSRKPAQRVSGGVRFMGVR